ncbi:MAG: M13 family metallopeptidase [Bacteroidales bacterium]|nr:M13 family metallopeptidase [Bacteroidales bacterium]
MKKCAIAILSMAVLLVVFTSSAPMDKKSKPKKKTSGITLTNLDNSVKPTVDFYQYACGGWQKMNPMGPEYARYGSFDVLGENNKQQIKDLVTKLASKKQLGGTIEQQVGDLYKIGMDSVKLQNQGAQPIQAQLQKIAIMKRDMLPTTIAQMHLQGIYPFFALYASSDPDNSDMTIAHLWQSGLGIGDRDYYIEENQQHIRDEYIRLMAKMFIYSGYNKLAGFTGFETEMARRVLDLETMMAIDFVDKTVLRDPYQTIHKCTPAEIQKMIPSISVYDYLNTLALQVDTINVGQPSYFTGLNHIVSVADLDVLRAYLAWNVIRSAASYLSDDFVNANFDFYGKVLSGKQENSPRWKRVIGTVESSLGEALGQMYVKAYFSPEAKSRMEQLVANLQWALGERIKNSSWMTDETKKNALGKLSTFRVKIGYPDKWRDYSSLKITDDSYYANVVRARRFETAYSLSKIGKPVDKNEWQMTPQTVNAYYEPNTNEICFPAGILQPPFFDMNADDAANYGAIGVVIGHEMTHGFDDQGRNYDLNGNLTDWWTEADSKAFTDRAQIIVDHFNNIEVAPGVYGNGSFTLGENIADNGGLNVSYAAFQKAKREGGIEGEMDGFTPEQRFFLAYAAVWAANIRPEEILRRTKVDPHALGRWRVNGTLPHISAFYDAFNIKQGDPMWLAPEKRANIW